MKLSELKIFINSIPDSMNEFTVVNGEFTVDRDGNTFVMKNNKVLTVYVDRPNNEIQLLHQTDKEVKDMILGLDEDGNTESN
jgi:hypothetical protein